MDLAGRVALVTGAARRVGRAIALRLARDGCRLAVHYRGSEDDAARTVAECRGFGVDARAFGCELADTAATRELPGQVIAALGRLDVLICNASVFEPMNLEEFTVDSWESTLRVNLTAPMILAHAARAELRDRGGRIITLCDVSTQRPWPDHLAYAVSKGGLETLTKALARAFAPEVNVNGIAPGVAAWPEEYSPELRERLLRRVPLRRAGTPEDIASAVSFVLREGDYITGAILPVDGGRQVV